jgi:serine/threonine protein kinase/WD40 repeat protein
MQATIARTLGRRTMPKPPLRRLEELFHQAVALDPPQRPAFLDAACAGDAELRAAVEELLKHDKDGSGSDEFLTSPVRRQVEQLRPLLSTLPDVVQNRPGPTPQPLPTIAGYEVLEEIGRGGMGVVYKARQISLNRVVALKMLLARDLVNTDQLVRFRSEAEALAKLHHPNIVTIFEIAESEGRPYFTMEYISGPSLAQIISGHPQDVAAAAQLLEVVARAVHTVHQCGIIHRDLKPANVLLSFRREPPAIPAAPLAGGSRLNEAVPKITDFGLAKAQADERKLTKTGIAMGTPSYMAPEQARSKAVIGPATDIYSLGSILYEMLTGRPPFDAGGPAETVAQVLNDEPVSPSRLRPKLPRDVVTICLKCLEKTANKRYRSALELAEDLRRLQAGEPIKARPVGLAERAVRWCRRQPLVAGLGALSVLLALTCVATVIAYEIHVNQLLSQEVETEKQEIIQLDIRIGVRELEEGDTFAAVLHFTDALSLDDKSVGAHNHRTRIGIALRQCPRLIDMVSLEREVLCADAELVVTIGANHALELREVHGAQPIVTGLMPAELPHEGTLSPDGRFLGILGGKGAARIWDLPKNEPHDLPAAGRSGVQRLVFHPNGRVLLAQRTDGATEAWDLTTWTQVPWKELAKSTPFSTLTEDGRWLLTCDADHVGQVWDTGTGKPVGPTLHVEQPTRSGAVAPDGSFVAVVGLDNDLSIWDATMGRRVGKPIKLPDAVSRMAFSPDAQQVATIGNDRILRLWQAQTGLSLAQTAPLSDAARSVHFSADGRYLLTMGDMGEARVWDAATGQPATPPLHPGGRLAFAAFRAGGKEVVTISKGGTVCVWELPRGPELRRGITGETTLAKRQSIQLANGLTHPNPDGTRVLVREDAKTVHVLDKVAGETTPLPHRSPVRYAAFSADGDRILTACEDRSVRLWDATTGQLLAPPMHHRLAIQGVMFHDGDTRAYVLHTGDLVSIWDLQEDGREIGVLLILSEVLAGEFRGRDRQLRPLDLRSWRENWEKLSSAK